MAKKIQLHKQTLRVLSAEEMEAVAGGADTSQSAAALPVSQSCITVVGCFDGSTAEASALPVSQSCISVVGCIDGEPG